MINYYIQYVAKLFHKILNRGNKIRALYEGKAGYSVKRSCIEKCQNRSRQNEGKKIHNHTLY